MTNYEIKTADKHITITSRDEQRSLELTIVGYEFPDLTESSDEYDRNWLNVKIIGKKGGKTVYDFTDPCVLTWELSRIYDATDDLLKGNISEVDSDYMFLFTESTIFFNLIRTAGGNYMLHITAYDFDVRANLTDSELRHIQKLLALAMREFRER